MCAAPAIGHLEWNPGWLRQLPHGDLVDHVVGGLVNHRLGAASVLGDLDVDRQLHLLVRMCPPSSRGYTTCTCTQPLGASPPLTIATVPPISSAQVGSPASTAGQPYDGPSYMIVPSLRRIRHWPPGFSSSSTS